MKLVYDEMNIYRCIKKSIAVQRVSTCWTRATARTHWPLRQKRIHPGNPPDNKKESAAVKTSTDSVGQLASNFMKNVRVGCNEVFTNQNCSSLNTADKAASSRMIGTAGKPDMAGLPREYEMVRAAR